MVLKTLPPEIWSFAQPEELLGFFNSDKHAALCQRSAQGQSFFDELCKYPVTFRAQLRPSEVIPSLLQHCLSWIPESAFLHYWLTDVAQLCQVYCQELGLEKAVVHLDMERPCQRFHADNLTLRLVCPYRGPGTLWLPAHNLNLEAAEKRGTSNQEIAIQASQIQQLGEWDILVMKGRKAPGAPLYHRSPDPHPGDPASLLLKLDEAPIH